MSAINTASTPAGVQTVADHSARNSLLEIPLTSIDRWDEQPRRSFDEEALEELAASITEHGLLEPIIVRETAGGRFRIVAGERRWRACQMAGLDVVPVRNLGAIDDATALQLALVENLQRQDLDPIEEAEGYASLNRVCGLKQAEIAAAVNRSQPAIANAMRLLELPEDVHHKIRAKHLTPAHGRALVKYAKWPKLCTAIAEQAKEQGYTSKQLETGFDYMGIDSYALERKKLIVTVDRGLDEAALEAAGITIFKNSSWQHLTPDVELYKDVAPRLHQEMAEAQKRAQKALKERARDAGSGAQALIQLKDLNYDQYRAWRYGDDRPSGCGPDCPCQVQAYDDYAKQTIDICADPKRYDGLKKADEKRDREAKKARLTERLVDVERAIGEAFPNGRIADPSDLDRKAIALLAFQVLSRADERSRKAAFKRYMGDMVDVGSLTWEQWGYGADYTQTLEVLERLHPAGLIHVALHALLRKELAERYTGYATSSKMADWFVGPDPQDTGDDLPIVVEEVPATSTLDSDVEIARARLTAVLVDHGILDPDIPATDGELVGFANDFLKDVDLDDETVHRIVDWTDALGNAPRVA
jgi:ParB/RepB/Spo0J family partition protein